MPRIVRAEFLSYYNSRRNSDKLFNVFLIEDDDGTFRNVSEHGRRGTRLVRDTLCAKSSRSLAESKLRQKLLAKRNHRETPYTDDSFGYNYSQIAREYGFESAQKDNARSIRAAQPSNTTNSVQPKQNVVEFPVKPSEKTEDKPKQIGILNQEQMNSLEI